MAQKFKNIYLQNKDDSKNGKKSITIAFGNKDEKLYHEIKALSSEEFRTLIGYNDYEALYKKSEIEGLPISTYCLTILKKKLKTVDSFSDPLQVTFKGGQNEPLQNWYPFLEGYSPKFVEEISRDLMPSSKKIFDPFAGSGTTPITVSKLGKEAYFCELNPVLQFLIHVKSRVLMLDYNSRKELKKYLDCRADNIKKEILESNADLDLLKSYKKSFGDSQFFHENIKLYILKSRGYIDKVSYTNPLASQIITVAILSSLIPSSNLIRRGDLRFKNLEEKSKIRINYFEEVKANIFKISSDLESFKTISKEPQLVCENALNIGSVPNLRFDGVITSPPYLNGTNYFRNTKVELWFLRCIKKKEDLSIFRFKAVTAGINDVTKKKDKKAENARLSKIVNKLEAVAYDSRIPKMVSSYFYDMKMVFSNLSNHLKPGTPVAIDIGDSVYSNIHIPTNEILIDLFGHINYKFCDEYVLRERVSRGGQRVKQTLLKFEYSGGKKVIKKENGAKWNSKWKIFKTTLPHQENGFQKRNWGHQLHSLCSYQGKMKPALAHHLVKTFLGNRGKMLDPFSGVGTIPFEAALNGIKAYGFEISPSAYIISKAKIGTPNLQNCKKIIKKLKVFIGKEKVSKNERDAILNISFNKNITEYFHPKTLNEIILSRRYLRYNPISNEYDALVFSCLMHILHGNRPYALSRRSHPITPFAPTGDFEYKSLIKKLEEKVSRSLNLEYSDKFLPGTILFQDATSWWPQDIEELDAVITSPPFFDSTRFYLANWMRLWFCGWEKNDFKIKPLQFVDEKQKSSMKIYEPIFRQAKERLKQNGVLVFHLGKSKKCDMGIELKRMGKKWFNNADLYIESVKHCESHGIKDKGTVTDHQYLVLS